MPDLGHFPDLALNASASMGALGMGAGLSRVSGGAAIPQCNAFATLAGLAAMQGATARKRNGLVLMDPPVRNLAVIRKYSWNSDIKIVFARSRSAAGGCTRRCGRSAGVSGRDIRARNDVSMSAAIWRSIPSYGTARFVVGKE